MLSLTNHILETIADEKALTEVLHKYSIVPHFGNESITSHEFTKVVEDVCELSISHTACKNDINNYVFGNRADVVAQTIPGFFDEEFDGKIPRAEKIAFLEWLQELGITIPRCIAVGRCLEDMLADFGNAYLHLSIITVGSETRVFMEPFHYSQTAYLRPKSREVKSLMHTEYWKEDWWKKKKPTILLASSPGGGYNWQKTGQGKLETILHIKSSKGKSKYYGRPQIMASLYWMFVEYQQANLAVKTSSTEFTAKKAVAFEEPPPERKKNSEKRKRNFKAKMNTLRMIATNEGDHTQSKSLFGMEYPRGGNPPTVLDFEINRDTAYSKHIIETAVRQVHAPHGWDCTLTNLLPTKSNIGGNVYADTLKQVAGKVVEPKNDFWGNIFGEMFKQIALQTADNRETRALRFKSNIRDIIDDLSNSQLAPVTIQQGNFE